MSELKLPIRYYYSLSEAAKELGCTENDLVHWGATQQIELAARLPIFQDGIETFPATDIFYSFVFQRNGKTIRQTEKLFPETICLACLYSYDLSALEVLDEIRVYTAYQIYEFSTNRGFSAETVETIVQNHFNRQAKNIGFNCLKINHQTDKLEYTNPFFEIWLNDSYCEANNLSDGCLTIKKENLCVVTEEIQRLKNNTELTPEQLEIMVLKSTRPKLISSQHRENLLRRIKAEGLDALQLTAGKGGKSGSKAQIKALLVPNTMTNSQFDKTWESAMRDQVIQYKP